MIDPCLSRRLGELKGEPEQRATPNKHVPYMTQAQFMDALAFFHDDARLVRWLGELKKRVKRGKSVPPRDKVMTLSPLTQETPTVSMASAEIMAMALGRVYSGDDGTAGSLQVKILEYLQNTYGNVLEPRGSHPESYLLDEVCKMMGTCARGWKVVQYLGAGVSGMVFLMQDPQNHYRAVKFVKKDIVREVCAQMDFHRHGLAVKVYGVEKMIIAGHSSTMVIMDPVSFTLKDALGMAGMSVRRVTSLAGQVVDILGRMRDAHITHGDMHPENIAFIPTPSHPTTYKMVLIDFGRSSTGGANTEVDVAQFVRVLVDLMSYKHAHIFVHAIDQFLKSKSVDYVIRSGDEYMRLYADFREKRQVSGTQALANLLRIKRRV